MAFVACAAVQSAPLSTVPQPWVEKDHIVDGWDWSLPPGTRASPRGWVAYGHERDLDFNLPSGNRVIPLYVNWRELEPTEGRYDFDGLRARIREIGQHGLGVNLYLRASVWSIAPWAPEGQPRRTTRGDPEDRGSAPRWLTNYAIPFIREKPITNSPNPFQIVNFDIFHPEYHRRYMRLVAALGRSGISDLPEIKVAYLCDKSATNGEEGWTESDQPSSGEAWERYQERLRAWAAAFGGQRHKLMTVSSRPHILKLCYELGIGQRNGFVEMYLGHAANEWLGQRVDADGYLVTDESCPLIARRLASGDENEEYGRGWVSRFGPYETFPHRYRESMLRALQMRRSYLLVDRSQMDPPLFHYVCLELGRTVEDAPDIWCYLRETLLRQHPQGVKNFERWLHQRDREGCRTVATDKIEIEKQHTHKFDYTARRTDIAGGNRFLGFAVDDRFLKGGPHRVAFKVTYRDEGPARWRLEHATVAGAPSEPCEVNCAGAGTGEVRTATLIRENVRFDAAGMEFDFTLRALQGDAVIKFVRVVRLPAK